MVQLRRSTRTRSQKTHDADGSDQNISTIESDKNIIIGDQTTPAVSKEPVDDSESEIEENQEEIVQDGFSDSSSSSEEEDPNDDDYMEPSTARKRKRSGKRSTNSKREGSTQKPAAKRHKANVKRTTLGNGNIPLTEEEQRDYLENVKAVEHSDLFEALAASDDISIDEYLRGWLENYESDRDSLLEEFINFLLDCCGALIHVEKHDVHNNESATDTITEIQLLFEKQKVHEFHLMISKTNKKASSYPILYKNFVEFMSKLLDVANDLQLLYVESKEDINELIMGPFVVDILTWLSALTVAKIRCFRYISTLALYLFQDFLTQHIVDLEKNYLAKFTKQLTSENKKKRSNKVAISKLEDNIEEIQNSKIITENIIENIIKICFVHRFKDVDEIIRSDSIQHLSIWIKNYPEYFMKVTYLKYFGWLLSDTSNIVRSQVLKMLPNIISSNHSKTLDHAAIRQFFERFRQRILDIVLKDVDLEVRLYATNILSEIITLGYLEDDEILAISSLIFDDNDIKVSSHSKNSRFLNSVAKFLATVTDEACKDFIKNNESLDENMAPVKTSVLIKIGIIMRFLRNSFLFYIQDNGNELDSTSKLHILYQAAEFLSPYFCGEVGTICRLLGDDNSYAEVFKTIERISKVNEQTTTSTQDEDTNIVTFNTAPLLPTNNNDTVFYLTVLNGLCYGASSIKNQEKSKTTKLVLPHLLQLFKNLPIHSLDVFPPLLDIFNLFSFEDWIQANSEEDILNIVQIITKTVDESILQSCDPENIYFKALSNTLDHIEGFKRSEFDELWINEIATIKLRLTKFLSESIQVSDEMQSNELTNTLYSLYVNKLILIGKVYPIEFNHDLLVLLFKKFFSLIPQYYKHFDSQTLLQINFKLPVLLVSWELHKWTEISKKASILSNNATTTNNSSDSCNDKPNDTSDDPISETFNNISGVLDQLCNILITITSADSVSIHDLFKVKWELSNSVIDIVVALKCFELQLPVENGNWKTLMLEKFPIYLHDDVQHQFKEVFLYLESLYANEHDTQLERVGDEDVALNEIHNSSYFTESEKGLLVYILKLKGLLRLGLLDEQIVSRLKLNEDKFPQLYQDILDDSIFEDQTTSAKSLNTNAAPRDNVQSDIPLPQESRASTTELDPLEDSSTSSTQGRSRSRNAAGDRLELGIIQENSREGSEQQVNDSGSSPDVDNDDLIDESSNN